MDIIRRNWLTTTVSLATVGALTSAFLRRKEVSRLIWDLRMISYMRSVKDVKKKVYIMSNGSEWNGVLDRLCRSARKVGAVGFDCEWVQTSSGKRRPVALLQMATHSGECALIRLCHMQSISKLPLSLKNILEDENILKVGVGADFDKQYLFSDYGLNVNGVVDLRYLAVQADSVGEGGTSKLPLGLSALSERYLGKKLDKDWRVSASDWEAETLTKRQVEYASEDAITGVQLLFSLVSYIKPEISGDEMSTPLMIEKEMINSIVNICSQYKDVEFKDKSTESSAGASEGLKKATRPVDRITVMSDPAKSYAKDGWFNNYDKNSTQLSANDIENKSRSSKSKDRSKQRPRNGYND